MSMTTTLTGILINARLWDMVDDQTKEQRAGTTINIAIPIPADKLSKHYVGSDVMKLTGSNLLFPTIDPTLIGKSVDIVCEMQAGKQGFKAVPKEITKAK